MMVMKVLLGIFIVDIGIIIIGVIAALLSNAFDPKEEDEKTEI